jgi:ketosteroid isomerase-like protein
MPDESMTPGPVELTRRFIEAANRGDVDAMMDSYAPDAVYTSVGLGTRFDGLTAIRGQWEDWTAAYEEFSMEAEEILDLGNGAVLTVVTQTARPVGSTGSVRVRLAVVSEWVEGAVVRTSVYTDIDEARATAERLAEERADG